ncbi:DNA repair and recombination protein RAD54B [Strigomonas culicis]|nr:DNA repair and recombination protein RAD54B [Strigomonas culicis]|eukprot:EPY34186.1 DNA repair and recombination protein RAD54B [Strigomonas culicis]
MTTDAVADPSAPVELEDLTGMEEVDATKHPVTEYLDEDNFELINDSGPHFVFEGDEMRLVAVFIKNGVNTAVCRKAAAVLEPAATKENLRMKTNGGIPPNTGIVGYYDYLTNPTQHKCRETEFMRKNWHDINDGCGALLHALDFVYRQYAPIHYNMQKIAIPSNFQLLDTVFSTITVNRNFRTAVHTDKGDFKSGFAVLSVINGTYDGCHLAIKKLRKSFKMGVGDVLLFDASLEHGNTQVHNPDFCWNRTSVVCYLRNGLCSAVCEMEQRKHLNYALIRKLNSAPTSDTVVNLNGADDSLPPLFVPTVLARKLAPVQLSALNFINDRAYKNSGCVVAMAMGLGKTLVALCTCFSHLYTHPSQDVLILTPKPIIPHWIAECEKWKQYGLNFSHFVASDGLDSLNFEKALYQYDQQMTGHATKAGHVFVLNPEYVGSFVRRFNQFDPKLLIVDEGHRVASKYSKLNQFLENMKCSIRVVLTGTPIQNDFSELYRLVSWVNKSVAHVLPNRHFLALANHIDKYINGEDTELSNAVGALSYIQEWMKGFVFREVENDLPPLRDYLVVCNTSETQKQIVNDITGGKGFYVVSATDFRPYHLSTHPLCYYAFISGKYQSSWRKSDGKHAREEEGTIHSLGNEGIELAETCSKAVCASDIDFFVSLSGKMAVLTEIMRRIVTLKEKVIIFSQYVGTQDFIYRVLTALQIPAYTVRGQDSLEKRRYAISLFHHEESLTALVLSTKIAAYGLDFTVANHVVLFDSWWNPQVDAQAIARAYRRNQTKPVTVYRLASHMEDQHIIRVQMRKIALFRCIMYEEAAKVSEMSDCSSTDSNSELWQSLKDKPLEGNQTALISVFRYEEAVKKTEQLTSEPDKEANDEEEVLQTKHIGVNEQTT